jgi:hypothetical protein
MISLLLHSVLLNFGVTPGGALQFIGLSIVSQKDRDALRANVPLADDGAELPALSSIVLQSRNRWTKQAQRSSPAARIVGCDASAAAVAEGHELVPALSIGNVELHRRDLCELNADP